MKRSFLSVVVCSAVILSSCGRVNTASKISDVVSPVREPVRMLIANLSVGSELDLLLKNYGYIPGSNCFQHILNQFRDGSTYETIELFQGPCRPFPIQEKSVAQLRLRLDTSGRDSTFTHWVSVMGLDGNKATDTRPVGRVTINYPFGRSGQINNLCDLHFSSICDVNLDNNGTITRLTMK